MTFGFMFGSVLGKTWVLVRLVLAGFWFLPISDLHTGACNVDGGMTFPRVYSTPRHAITHDASQSFRHR